MRSSGQRRERDLFDPFDDVRRELPRLAARAEERVQSDAVDPAIVEAVDDPPDPLGVSPVARAISRLQSPPRESRMTLARRLLTALDSCRFN
jgi:hypothetical protein